jgi:hypothetical protein
VQKSCKESHTVFYHWGKLFHLLDTSVCGEVLGGQVSKLTSFIKKEKRKEKNYFWNRSQGGQSENVRAKAKYIKNRKFSKQKFLKVRGRAQRSHKNPNFLGDF